MKPKRPLIGLGFGLAIVYLLLFLLPLLPGKVWLSSPGSSGSLQASGGSLSCTGDSSQPTVTKSYTSKKGFPIAYSYSYQSTISATCNGVNQSAGGSTVSSSNMLGIIVDIAAASLLAFVTTKIVRLLQKTKSA